MQSRAYSFVLALTLLVLAACGNDASMIIDVPTDADVMTGDGSRDGSTTHDAGTDAAVEPDATIEPDANVDDAGNLDAEIVTDAEVIDATVDAAMDPCTALACVHGTCMVEAMAASCVCATGFTGTLCDMCEVGLQDHDGDGVCRPACTASTCEVHETCDDSSGEAMCACSIGYTAGPDGLCHFVGIQDPDFIGAVADVWSTSGASIVTGTLPAGGMGAAQFSLADFCDHLGSVSQVVALPAAADGPYALTVRARAECNGDGCGNYVEPALAVQVGGSRVNVTGALGIEFSERSVCLWAPPAGGLTHVTLSPGYRGVCYGDYSSSLTEVDSVTLAVDPSCPPPGAAFVNPTLSGGDLGWTLHSEAANGAANTAEIVAGGPIDGSASIHLYSAAVCNRLYAESTIVFDPTPGQALVFQYRAPEGKNAFLTIDGQWIGNVAGDGGTTNAMVCIPSALGGIGHTLQVDASYGGGCAPDPADIYMDNFAIVSAAECANSITMQDPGFEHLSDPSPAWQTWSSMSYSGATTVSSEVYAGTTSLKMSSSNGDSISAYTTIVSPVSVSGAGPALRYRSYNASDADELKFYLGSTGNELSVPLTTGAAPGSVPTSPASWEEHVFCLPPELAGTIQYFEIDYQHAGTTPVAVFFDSFEGVTDPSCPTE